MTVAKKATTVTKKDTVPKPKFGEVGFKFPVMAEIVHCIPDNNDEYPIRIKLNLGDFEDKYWITEGMEICYNTHKNFKAFYAKCDPKFVKTQKQQELKQAQALVAKLTKEISELK